MLALGIKYMLKSLFFSEIRINSDDHARSEGMAANFYILYVAVALYIHYAPLLKGICSA